MKKLLGFTLLASLMFLLTACPYQSNVPIGEANEEVNESFLGEWVNVEQSEEDYPVVYTISYLTDNMYEIVEKTVGSGDYSTYTMHSTTIRNNMFVNIKPQGEDFYYIYKMEKIEGLLVLHEVSDYIDEEFPNSRKFKRFVRRNMNLSFFYTPFPSKYIRYENN